MMRELRRFEIDPETREVLKPSMASTMTARQISVWDTLAVAADYGTGIARRSINSICRAEGLSRSQMCVVLNELEAMGGLVRIRSGTTKQTMYKVVLPSPVGRTSKKDTLVRRAGPALVRSTRCACPANRTLFVTPTRNPQSKKSVATPAVAFPPLLDTPLFHAAWSEYLAYRRESKLSTLKPRSVTAKLAECAGWGHDEAIESIRMTIANGWQGLFAAKPKGNSHDRIAKRPENRGQFAEPSPKIRTRTAGDVG